MVEHIAARLKQSRIIAILRGLSPAEAAPVGGAVVGAGIDIVEVPLNSPDPYRSIERLAECCSGQAVVGAGTVLRSSEVDEVHAAGGQLIVSPNTDADVIRRALDLGLMPLPGFCTPTEAFTALHAGASVLKLFPAHTFGVKHLNALQAVLPRGVPIVAVGGIEAGNVLHWLDSGAAAVGIGTALYQAGRPIEEIAQRAQAIHRLVHRRDAP
ncbi:MAG TPA: 2-dehydro-3-deoxy-6-phosphogalactonate aldolase [Steroidobacteraceae bacterium]|nr:2-dehydro-3-deoxy-6-phosphogalactonate aldolase [Steroidobacteraceae bacterium]